MVRLHLGCIPCLSEAPKSPQAILTISPHFTVASFKLCYRDCHRRPLRSSSLSQPQESTSLPPYPHLDGTVAELSQLLFLWYLTEHPVKRTPVICHKPSECVVQLHPSALVRYSVEGACCAHQTTFFWGYLSPRLQFFSTSFSAIALGLTSKPRAVVLSCPHSSKV